MTHQMSIKVLCFDIGGVLAHVNLTWAGAMRAAGVAPTLPDGGRLEDCLAFVQFQNGELELDPYLTELSSFLKIDRSFALAVHDGILDRPTEGTLEIVRSLNGSDVVTACLSNTNGPHWEVLTDPARFPNIASLKLQKASQNYGVSKPDEKIYRYFERDAEAKPSEILFFEDNFANLQAAIGLGWHGVQIDPTSSQKDQIRNGLQRHGIELPLDERSH